MVEDESMISIRSKDEASGKVELSMGQTKATFLVTVIFLPLAIALSGLMIWIFRKRL